MHCNNIITERDSTKYKILVMLDAQHVSAKGSELFY